MAINNEFNLWRLLNMLGIQRGKNSVADSQHGPTMNRVVLWQ